MPVEWTFGNVSTAGTFTAGKAWNSQVYYYKYGNINEGKQPLYADNVVAYPNPAEVEEAGHDEPSLWDLV